MKKYTHAWLAFMAIKRLQDSKLSADDRRYADSLIGWFMDHRDDVIQGAWYPDAVIKDMATSHVLKLAPSATSTMKYKTLPPSYLSLEYGQASPAKARSFTIDTSTNLPDRCESIAHSVIDDLKLQQHESKGSPVSPTNNHIALLLFMLSHYVADGHMPLHCDARAFSKGIDLHSRIEGEWEDAVEAYYRTDKPNERFLYDPDGYPLKNSRKEQAYQSSVLAKASAALDQRQFDVSWGRDNKNVWDFMSAICQYSYLLSYCFIPEKYDWKDVTAADWQSLGTLRFEDFSVAVLADAIDSVARVWLRVWRRYMKWEKEQDA